MENAHVHSQDPRSERGRADQGLRAAQSQSKVCGHRQQAKGGGDSIPATEKPLPSPHRDGHLSPAPHVQAGQFDPHRTMAFEPVRFEVIRYTATIVTSQLRMAARLEY